ncbi:signal recognition particle-docking protein FtsY [Fructobacillus sp. M1-13]|uniref:Signal recognition particle receptor FtsY n=1 Tax=Fructobacillus papyriferae TaxID=2713171 RepID=A0ABS5QQT5_9LACO|nr:signal recognition particle-docking protein FtsY [Fructobacillus papyriferae]MBS9334865.1 signal recognition particle-docking protein FtsY [Fructobacillus papyriferae]MCD2158855.1 signal recognition particle-docking protein FtsY [Fructobacillus papyriferae]
MGLFDRFKKNKKQEAEAALSPEEAEVVEPTDYATDATEADESAAEEALGAELTEATDATDAATSDRDSEAKAAEDAKAEGEADSSSKSERAVYEKGLTQSRKGFAERFNRFLANFRSVDEDFFEELEDTLIGADLGFDLAISISNQVREEVKLENVKDPQEIRELIIRLMVASYEKQGEQEDQSMHFAKNGEPTVILFVGVNGVGKTTTVGKMAKRYKDQGKSIMLAAADTFRAGAVKQLQEWGDRADVPVVAGPEKADPASVVYQAVEKAKAEGTDILFVDTAGRLQNNVNLMQELAKMNRVIQKVLPEAPQEVLLVLDATTGQNALQQAKLFKDSSEVTGLVLTKMDGTAKGGIVFAIRDQLHLPVKWIGFGEKAEDLRVFSAEDFVFGLFKDLVNP